MSPPPEEKSWPSAGAASRSREPSGAMPSWAFGAGASAATAPASAAPAESELSEEPEQAAATSRTPSRRGTSATRLRRRVRELVMRMGRARAWRPVPAGQDRCAAAFFAGAFLAVFRAVGLRRTLIGVGAAPTLDLEVVLGLDQRAQLRGAVAAGVEGGVEVGQVVAEGRHRGPAVVGRGLVHRRRQQPTQVRQPRCGLRLAAAVLGFVGRFVAATRSPEQLELDEPVAGCAERLRRLALAQAVHRGPRLAQACRQPGEVAVAGDDRERVEPAGVEQVHGVDDQRGVRAVLPGRVGELLHGLDRVPVELRLPPHQVLGGPVAVRALDRGHAVLGELLEQVAGVARRGVVGIDQDGEAILGWLWHAPIMADACATSASPPRPAVGGPSRDRAAGAGAGHRRRDGVRGGWVRDHASSPAPRRRRRWRHRWPHRGVPARGDPRRPAPGGLARRRRQAAPGRGRGPDRRRRRRGDAQPPARGRGARR